MNLNCTNDGINDCDETFFTFDFFLECRTFNAEKVAELEHQLLQSPNSLECHSKLAAYFMPENRRHGRLGFLRMFGKEYSTDDRERRYRHHALWIIQNCPRSKISEHPVIMTFSLRDKEGHRLGSEIWDRHVEENPSDAKILYNASRFFWYSDISKSLDLKDRASRIEPDNPSYQAELASSYSILAEKVGAENQDRMFQRALVHKEQELKLSVPNSKEFLDVLYELPSLALNAGDLDKSRTYSMQLCASDYKVAPYIERRCLHRANIMLGFVALRMGDKDAAIKLMLKSVDFESFQLSYDKVDLKLASELLSLGEREAVLQYLYRCLQLYFSFSYARLYFLVYLKFLPKFGRLDKSRSRLDLLVPSLVVTILRPLAWLYDILARRI